MKPIPFSPPRIDEATIAAVTEVLRSGWITTGPKTRELERRIGVYCGSPAVLCLNSWTNAAELVLRWFGIGPGDEVIVPVYTYAATANIVVHLGATPVPVDTAPGSFLADLNQIRKKISPRTKAIMPVDIGGLPVDYAAVMNIAEEARSVFVPLNDKQRALGRPLVISDAAHSFGALCNGKHVGSETDVAGFSFHAVKNLTTAEGGAITLQLPPPFDNQEIWKELNISALHGQTKDALSKNQAGQWRYDIVEAGYKCNLTDIHAAIGLVELDRYDSETLPKRKLLCDHYTKRLSGSPKFILPEFISGAVESSYHLFMLRIKGASEEQRDEIIRLVALDGISVNVHFQPLPLLSFYQKAGWRMSDFPEAWSMYCNEISLPVYYDLTMSDVDRVCDSIISATDRTMS